MTDGKGRTWDGRGAGVIGRIAAAVDSYSIRPGTGAALFLALVYSRNILEGVFESGRMIGFSADGGVSSFMVFDHYPVFYAALFLALASVLSGAAGVPLRAALRTLLAGWAVILLPPVIDALASGGLGFTITYTPDFLPTALRFWTADAPPELSVGQRAEIILALLLVFLYTRGRGVPVVRGLLAVLLFFLTAALYGALPSLFARIPWPWAGENAGSYARVFLSAGVIEQESQRHALLFTFLLIAAGAAVLARLEPEKARVVFRNLRPLRSAHYAGFTLFGFVFGAVLLRPYLGVEPVAGPMDALAGLALVLAVFHAFQCGAAWNDLADRRADLRNEPARPLPSGRLRPEDVKILALLHAAAAALLSVNVGHAAFLLIGFSLALSALYSFSPFRLKRIPFVATWSLALVSLTVFLAGFSAWTGPRAFHLLPKGLAAAILAGITLAFPVKDLKDEKGDREDGTWTLPVLLGERRARPILALLAAAGFLAPALFLGIGALWIAAPPFAAAAAWMTLRIRRPDRPMLMLYLPYACVILVLLLANADRFRLRPGVESWGRAAGARALLFRDGDMGAALFFERAAASGGEEAIRCFDLPRGMALVRTGRPLEAIPLLEAAVRRTPQESRAWTYLADAALLAGDPERARAVLTGMAARSVLPWEALRRSAAISLDRGELGRAAREIEAGMNRGGFEEKTALQMGDLFLLAGEPARALPWYEKGGRIGAAPAEAASGRARALHALGRTAEARHAFDEALRLAPDDPVIAHNAAVAAEERGEEERALELLERAARLDPLFGAPLVRAGAILERRGDREGALRAYREALFVEPGNHAAREGIRRLSGEDAPPPSTPGCEQFLNFRFDNRMRM